MENHVEGCQSKVPVSGGGRVADARGYPPGGLRGLLHEPDDQIRDGPQVGFDPLPAGALSNEDRRRYVHQRPLASHVPAGGVRVHMDYRWECGHCSAFRYRVTLHQCNGN